MQYFSKDLLKESRPLDVNLLTEADKLSERTRQKYVIMNNMQIAQLATPEDSNKYIYRNIAIISVLMLSNSIAYPLLSRLFRRILRTNDFLILNFSVIPLLLNINAITVGVAQGFANAKLITKRYSIQSSKKIENDEDQQEQEKW